jgi:hypothetical protein
MAARAQLKPWPKAPLAAARTTRAQAVDASSRAVRADVAATTELLAADLARVSKEAAALRGSLSGVASGMQQQQHELGMLAPRVGRLEALESSTPRASLRLATALEAKVDNMAAQQVRGEGARVPAVCWMRLLRSRGRHDGHDMCLHARTHARGCLQARYTKSVEGVVSALVDDTVGLSKSARHLEGLVQHQQGQLQDTKEALLRCGVGCQWTQSSTHSAAQHGTARHSRACRRVTQPCYTS